MIESQTTATVLMIQPVHFSFNEQTAKSNSFMNRLTKNQSVHSKALREFDLFAEKLTRSGIRVLIVQDAPEPHSPDSIFPNNWISTHADGTIFTYPMEAENRRTERRVEILDLLKTSFKCLQLIDLSYFEREHKFLEGTGSMVLDRINKIVYSCLSSRTHPEVLAAFCEKAGYQSLTFKATDSDGKVIYHTNVMMYIGAHLAIICLEAVTDIQQRLLVRQSLERTGKEIIEIDFGQLHHFAGNAIELKNKDGDSFLVLSEQAFKSLSANQLAQIRNHCKPLISPLYTIENAGGGSARCMIAEIFLPERT